MADDRDVMTMLRRLIAQETKFLRHYIGPVMSNSDSLERGRVLIQVPALGWMSQAQGAWAWPRAMHSLSVPKVGEWVELYFINGQQDYPVYLGIAGEIRDMIVKAFNGVASTHVIFEDPDSEGVISFDAQLKKFVIGAPSVTDPIRIKNHVESDATTDPDNWTLLTMLAAMFGLTITKLDALLDAQQIEIDAEAG